MVTEGSVLKSDQQEFNIHKFNMNCSVQRQVCLWDLGEKQDTNFSIDVND
jgi:hypothetical protein